MTAENGCGDGGVVADAADDAAVDVRVVDDGDAAVDVRSLRLNCRRGCGNYSKNYSVCPYLIRCHFVSFLSHYLAMVRYLLCH